MVNCEIRHTKSEKIGARAFDESLPGQEIENILVWYCKRFLFFVTIVILLFALISVQDFTCGVLFY